MGVDFTRCNPYAFSITCVDTVLDYSIFYGCKLRQTVFRGCSLKQVEFEQADLTGVVFNECNLEAANFQQSKLEKADFRTAHHFSIDPEANKVKGAKFSSQNLAGLLGKYRLDIRLD